ncbi:hypothetical protein BEWA_029090 [Theileria equi strain WA]|uniref:Uncharacterized protein n=1 Tax=Theileria equi strain WA TaxID=1537102 RepID=L0AYT7_THEEQ|nr:hypothetical protein BEWA_029090 [Theileria equi strain WA]AFZ80059.1 hypothetical protein BEWA_029090 [Theileria equi strain WA]|eukprot:XP_004829725.1 hypothetical protein BEWA_029090 [Theileria equi strain WA]
MFGVASSLPPQMLRVCTRTWIRDSHDLFDYETHQQVKLYQFATSSALRLLRSDADVTAMDYNAGSAQVEREHDHLLTIVSKRNGEYVVFPAEKAPGSFLAPQKLWIIVRALPCQRYALQENDVIKLGRFRLRVKQLVPKSSDADQVSVRLYDSIIPERNIPPEELATMQCRICLTEGGSDDDKLICACECKGSIKYVHAECLRKWINSRSNIKEGEKLPALLFIREVSCELCKAQYPTCVKQNGEVIQIVCIPQVSAPFIVLENVTPHAVRGIHLLSMKDMKDLKLGRGHESDVRIPDVSISRYHATIRYEGNVFYLEDHNSKFGTLVAMRRPKLIGASENLALQVGRSVVELTMDPTLPYVPGRIDLPPVPGTFGYCGDAEQSMQTDEPTDVRVAEEVAIVQELSRQATPGHPTRRQTCQHPPQLSGFQEHIINQLRYVYHQGVAPSIHDGGQHAYSQGASPSIRSPSYATSQFSQMQAGIAPVRQPQVAPSVRALAPSLTGSHSPFGLSEGRIHFAEPECALPDSIFIANWNSVPQRTDQGDTSTSALDFRDTAAAPPGLDFGQMRVTVQDTRGGRKDNASTNEHAQANVDQDGQYHCGSSVSRSG